MSGGQYRRFLLAYGLLPLRKQPYAGMVKLVNTQDLGSCAFACGFESHYPHHGGAKPVPCKLRRLKMSRRIFYPCRLPCLRGRAAGRCCCVAKPDDSTRKRLFRSTRSFPVEKTEQKKYNGNRPEAKGLRRSVRLVPPSFRRSRKNMSLLTASSAESRWRGYEYFAHKKVLHLQRLDDTRFQAVVSGSRKASYEVIMDLDHVRRSSCTCPHAAGRRVICKHMLAVFFTAFPEEEKSY